MARSSPRASMGLRRFPASRAPSAAPAPTTVWSSSMKRMTWPSDSCISFKTAFSRSSNWPRNLAPAIREPMSRAMMRLSFRPSGTSFATMRRARPSTMAVLPTPASPMMTGLFLVRRDRISMTRLISSSRPITGSSLPSRARRVRSLPYLSRASYVDSGFSPVTCWLPRRSFRAVRTLFLLIPAFLKTCFTSWSPSSSSASSKCSTLTNISFMFWASFSALRKTLASPVFMARGPS